MSAMEWTEGIDPATVTLLLILLPPLAVSVLDAVRRPR